jgi:hypothetical protein
MKRPSYLRQIAACPRSADDIAALVPPRLFFRPSPARPGFTIIEERADLQLQRAGAAQPGLPLATPLAPEPIANLPELAVELIRPSALNLHRTAGDIAAATAAGLVLGQQPVYAGPRPPIKTPIAAAMEHLDAPRVVARPDMSLQSPIQAVNDPREAQPMVAKPPPDDRVSRRAKAPGLETQRAPRDNPTLPLHSVPASEFPFPRPILGGGAQPTSTRGAQPIAPAARPRPPGPIPTPPSTTSSLVPPAPLPRTSMAERASPAVRIGTLEVRVIAPAATPVAVEPVPALPATRPASRLTGSAIGTRRLARGFGSFGLSQA